MKLFKVSFLKKWRKKTKQFYETNFVKIRYTGCKKGAWLVNFVSFLFNFFSKLWLMSLEADSRRLRRQRASRFLIIYKKTCRRRFLDYPSSDKIGLSRKIPTIVIIVLMIATFVLWQNGRLVLVHILVVI